MDNYLVVRSEHLNHHGFLFGGYMLQWVDEMAWLTASKDFPKCFMVTVGLEAVSFKERCICGSILRFSINPQKMGKTSITYSVSVYADEPGANTEKSILTTYVTFVRVDKEGNKLKLPDKDINNLNTQTKVK